MQYYVIKFVSDLGLGLLRVLLFPPRYNWNIVESGVKHHKQNQYRIGDVIVTYIMKVIPEMRRIDYIFTFWLEFSPRVL